MSKQRPLNTHRNLGRFLVDSSPALWLGLETLLAWGFFYFFSSFGKGAELIESQVQNQKGAFLYAMAFGIVGVGLGLFDKENRFNRLKSLQLITLTSIIAAVLGLFILYFTSFQIVGRWSLAYGSAGATLSLYVFIHFTGGILLKHFPHRYLLVGTPSTVGTKILSITNSNGAQYKHASELYEKIFQQNLISTHNPEALATELRNEGVSDLVISWDSKNTPQETQLLFSALRQGLRIIDDVQYYTSMTRRIPVECVPDSYILKMGFDIHRPLSGMAKRIFDIIFAIILILLFSPIFLLTSIAIVLESGFPIFYTQSRYGRFGKKFSVFKFRSMYTNQKGPEFTRPNDSRITWIGKWIRRAHIDEFPQLINILGGSMSFVGPRPESAEIIEEKSKTLPLMHLRHIVRPGLTGHAQISQGKTEDDIQSLQTKLSLDLYYIKNFDFFLDLTILAKTTSNLLKSTW